MNRVAKLCAALSLSAAVLPTSAAQITVTAEPQAAQHNVSLPEYKQHLHQLRALVANCQSAPAACEPASTGADDHVADPGLGSGANVSTFTARYEWLRSTLKDVAKIKPSENNPKSEKARHDKLAAAATRLDSQIADADMDAGATPGAKTFPATRHAADAILNRPEFVTATETSLMERALARFFRWLDSLFNGVARFGRRSPWVTPLFEWSLVTLAAVVLLVWAMRVAKQQRLAVSQGSPSAQLTREDILNWLALAQQSAAQHDWRQAIHCLYWASIAALERRRLWAPDKSRTPREYVRLIHSGPARDLLDRQTRGFERIWYGLHPAAEHDYAIAQQIFDQIDQAR